MKNDAKIKKKVEDIRDKANVFLGYVNNTNPCAVSDRMIEEIISSTEELKSLYDEQFKERKHGNKK